MGIFLQNKYVSHERRPVIKDQKHIQDDTAHKYISASYNIPSYSLLYQVKEGVRNKHLVLNMSPLVGFFRFFRLYIDTTHAKINSVAICSRSRHKCPRLQQTAQFLTSSVAKHRKKHCVIGVDPGASSVKGTWQLKKKPYSMSSMDGELIREVLAIPIHIKQSVLHCFVIVYLILYRRILQSMIFIGQSLSYYHICNCRRVILIKILLCYC